MEFTLETYHKIKTAYKQAVDDNKTEFIFQDVILLTDYAKYLIEYLEMNKSRIPEK